MWPLRTWGASFTLRWRVSGVECELQITGTTGHVWLRRESKVVGSAAVASAVAATNGRPSMPNVWNRVVGQDLIDGRRKRVSAARVLM